MTQTRSHESALDFIAKAFSDGKDLEITSNGSGDRAHSPVYGINSQGKAGAIIPEILRRLGRDTAGVMNVITTGFNAKSLFKGEAFVDGWESVTIPAGTRIQFKFAPRAEARMLRHREEAVGRRGDLASGSEIASPVEKRAGLAMTDGLGRSEARSGNYTIRLEQDSDRWDHLVVSVDGKDTAAQISIAKGAGQRVLDKFESLRAGRDVTAVKQGFGTYRYHFTLADGSTITVQEYSDENYVTFGPAPQPVQPQNRFVIQKGEETDEILGVTDAQGMRSVQLRLRVFGVTSVLARIEELRQGRMITGFKSEPGQFVKQRLHLTLEDGSVIVVAESDIADDIMLFNKQGLSLVQFGSAIRMFRNYPQMMQLEAEVYVREPANVFARIHELAGSTLFVSARIGENRSMILRLEDGSEITVPVDAMAQEVIVQSSVPVPAAAETSGAYRFLADGDYTILISSANRLVASMEVDDAEAVLARIQELIAGRQVTAVRPDDTDDDGWRISVEGGVEIVVPYLTGVDEIRLDHSRLAVSTAAVRQQETRRRRTSEHRGPDTRPLHKIYSLARTGYSDEDFDYVSPRLDDLIVAAEGVAEGQEPPAFQVEILGPAIHTGFHTQDGILVVIHYEGDRILGLISKAQVPGGVDKYLDEYSARGDRHRFSMSASKFVEARLLEVQNNARPVLSLLPLETLQQRQTAQAGKTALWQSLEQDEAAAREVTGTHTLYTVKVTKVIAKEKGEPGWQQRLVVGFNVMVLGKYGEELLPESEGIRGFVPAGERSREFRYALEEVERWKSALEGKTFPAILKEINRKRPDQPEPILSLAEGARHLQAQEAQKGAEQLPELLQSGEVFEVTPTEMSGFNAGLVFRYLGHRGFIPTGRIRTPDFRRDVRSALGKPMRVRIIRLDQDFGRTGIIAEEAGNVDEANRLPESEIKALIKSEKFVEVQITEVARNAEGNEAGLHFTFGGYDGFLPKSMIDGNIKYNLTALAGKPLRIRITEMKESRRTGRLELIGRQTTARTYQDYGKPGAQSPAAASAPSKKRSKPLRGGLTWGGFGRSEARSIAQEIRRQTTAEGLEIVVNVLEEGAEVGAIVAFVLKQEQRAPEDFIEASSRTEGVLFRDDRVRKGAHIHVLLTAQPVQKREPEPMEIAAPVSDETLKQAIASLGQMIVSSTPGLFSAEPGHKVTISEIADRLIIRIMSVEGGHRLQFIPRQSTDQIRTLPPTEIIPLKAGENNHQLLRALINRLLDMVSAEDRTHLDQIDFAPSLVMLRDLVRGTMPAIERAKSADTAPRKGDFRRADTKGERSEVRAPLTQKTASGTQFRVPDIFRTPAQRLSQTALDRVIPFPSYLDIMRAIASGELGLDSFRQWFAGFMEAGMPEVYAATTTLGDIPEGPASVVEASQMNEEIIMQEISIAAASQKITSTWQIQDQAGAVFMDASWQKALINPDNARALYVLLRIADEVLKSETSVKSGAGPVIAFSGERQAVLNAVRHVLTNKNNGLNIHERTLAGELAQRLSSVLQVVEPVRQPEAGEVEAAAIHQFAGEIRGGLVSLHGARKDYFASVRDSVNLILNPADIHAKDKTLLAYTISDMLGLAALIRQVEDPAEQLQMVNRYFPETQRAGNAYQLKASAVLSLALQSLRRMAAAA